TPHGQRQIHPRLADGFVQIDGRRRAIVVWNVERCAVRKDTPRAFDRDLADAELARVELQLGETPAVVTQRTAAAFDPGFDETVLLLEMMGLQEQALGPDDPVLPRHQ